MTVSTWSQSRCDRDAVEPRVVPLPFGWVAPPLAWGVPPALLPAEFRARPRAVHARPAHASAADAGAAYAGRRRAQARRDSGNDAGGHRAARRSVLPVRHASLAGQLAVAGAGSHHAP